MSISTWMVAQKRLTDSDRRLVSAFNELFCAGIEPPEDLIDELKYRLGKYTTNKALDDERFRLTNDVLEISLYGLWEGDIEYDEGATIDLDKLPEGTFAIRIYIE